MVVELEKLELQTGRQEIHLSPYFSEPVFLFALGGLGKRKC